MKNIFHPGAKEEIINRIGNLSTMDAPRWGHMNVSQMLAHCLKPLALAMGEASTKPANFMMKIFGKIIKRMVVSEKPYKQNLPTDPTFITTGNNYDFIDAQQQLMAAIIRFVEKQDIIPHFKHPFFGKLTKDEWGISQYKHLDHHLQQFGK